MLKVEMRVPRAALLTGLLILMFGMIGCTTAKPLSMLSLHGAGIGSATTGPSQQPTATQESGVAKTAQDTNNQYASTQHHGHAVQPVTNKGSKAPAVSPLITLGPKDDFHKLVKNAPGVVLVDFYADWCGPCRTQGGILHEMESFASQRSATIIKVNIDKHKRLARDFSVSKLPTLLSIKNGKIIRRQSGMADRQRVAALLSE